MKEKYDDLVKSDLDGRYGSWKDRASAWCWGREEVLMFCSNKYLGLNNHPRLRKRR